MMLRRAFIKIPSLAHTVSQIFSRYQKLCMPGAYHHQLDHATLTPAPLPGGDRGGEWKWQTTPPGPTGFLLENTFMLGGSLQLPQFIFRSNGGADVTYSLTLLIISSRPYTSLLFRRYNPRPPTLALSCRIVRALTNTSIGPQWQVYPAMCKVQCMELPLYPLRTKVM